MQLSAEAKRYDYIEEARLRYCPVAVPGIHPKVRTISSTITIPTVAPEAINELATPHVTKRIRYERAARLRYPRCTK